MKGPGPALGKLITTMEPRDAIHIAVAPVTAAEKLYPGNHLEFSIAGNVEQVVACNPTRGIGIVDPFLTQPVLPGQSFWMFLMPNTITGLRHEWTHPAFEQETKEISVWWLRDFTETYMHGLDYDEVVQGAIEGSIYSGDDIDYPSDDVVREFWKHIEIVTGQKFKFENVEAMHIFRCAC
jgi:hypothetical protein